MSRILMTGATSPLGGGVLDKLKENNPEASFWCGVHRRELPGGDRRVHPFTLCLPEIPDLPRDEQGWDLAIHFAALAHGEKAEDYWDVNYRGTLRLAEALFERGCRDFVYMSSYRASQGAGAYGESKLAAEEALQKFAWKRLLILRPAEVYGGGGNEGIDKFFRLGSSYHLVPMLFGNSKIRFCPLEYGNFLEWCLRLIQEPFQGVRKVNLKGPESLSGVEIALRISKACHAVPVPVYWDLLKWGGWLAEKVGRPIFSTDQFARVVSERTQEDQEESIPAEGLLRFPGIHFS